MKKIAFIAASALTVSISTGVPVSAQQSIQYQQSRQQGGPRPTGLPRCVDYVRDNNIQSRDMHKKMTALAADNKCKYQ